MPKEENPHDLDEWVQHSIGKEGICTIIDWAARFSYWVSPEVYHEVQVVYPKTRRKHPDEQDRSLVGGIAVWLNQPASKAFWSALGERPQSHTPSNYRNFILCHIYEGSAHDPEHFTNLANLTIFPRSLESFSEWEPVRAVLKWHSFKLYGYIGPRKTPPTEPEYYPLRWPGVRNHDPETLRTIVADLQEKLERRPTYYSKKEIVTAPETQGSDKALGKN